MTPPRSLTPRATYHAGFGFKDAAAIAPYLRRLGISHVYASPYLKARPGSTHGYDITDHQALNPELGTEVDFIAMVREFQREGLGQILDFVPNHMGVGGSDNALWLDVLEWGPDVPKRASGLPTLTGCISSLKCKNMVFVLVWSSGLEGT
jgi:(1->4)-alpha-D-glucan 1-alpha-D-glucosylmutase